LTEITQVAVVLILISLFLRFFNRYQASPVRTILIHWVSWILMAWLVAMVAYGLGVNRPFWVLFSCGFLLWSLLEGAYRWFALRVLSYSTFPLFPKYYPNTTGDEWPISSNTFLLRDWIKKAGFQKQGSFKAQIMDPLYLRTTCYLSADRKTQLWITFFPRQIVGVHTHYLFSSTTVDGERVITENYSLPFGGYYPDHWFVLRLPLVTSVEKLYRMHQQRVLKSGGIFTEPTQEPLDEINGYAELLEQINLERGFLLSREYHEEDGRISLEGRYRIWKEMWLLRYLGATVSYRRAAKSDS
jgi:hypothetical protein